MEIETTYQTLKTHFLPTTASKDFRLRFMFLVIGAILSTCGGFPILYSGTKWMPILVRNHPSQLEKSSNVSLCSYLTLVVGLSEPRPNTQFS